MTYTPYLVSNFASGITNRLQPWLSQDDAQQRLYDGDVYRGQLFKRSGYNYFATGNHGGTPYTESRIVNQIAAFPMAGTIDSVNTTFTLTANAPVVRGSFVVTGSDPAQSATDDGLGGFVTSPAGGSGTIDYITGAVSVTFKSAPTSGTVMATYNYMPDEPVMMVANFITSSNVKELIVADESRLNRYNSTTNRLEYLGTTFTITGISNTNPGIVTTSANHNLSTGDQVYIYGVVGTTPAVNGSYTITSTGATTFSIPLSYGVYTSGGTVQLIYSGSNFNFFSWVNYPDKDNNPRLLFTNNVNQIGYYAPSNTPSVGDFVAYPSYASPDFYMLATTSGTPAITTITCAELVVFKDRLLMLRTTENGVVYPQRIRISGTGANCDDFRTSATGAGFIDIPDGTWISGATANRDDVLIFTEGSTWTLKYTGNDTTPFVLDRIDETRGSGATFSVITYLNRSSAVSPRGLIISDGYRVERQDMEIPDFSFNEIDGANFQLCFAGTVDADRDHYLIYPPPGETESKRILVTNYDEDNYSIYRLPLSCMGTYITAFDITWDDLLVYPNWDAFAAAYGNWNSFAYTAGAPFSIGGGHHGEIWRLNVTGKEDNPVMIRNITVIDSTTIEVTTDWNNFSLNATDQELGADYIFLTAVTGMEEVNDKQYPIIYVTDNYTFGLNVPSTVGFDDYVSGGEAIRVIPFNALMKQFNPYIEGDKKVRCGWLYMYVNSTGTDLTRNVSMSAATNSNPCAITTNIAHGFKTGNQVTIFEVVGMTELNGIQFFITVTSPTSFTLDGVDSTSYGVYTSGGYAAVSEPCKLSIDVFTNDENQDTQLTSPDPYQGNCTNLTFEQGSKKWYKVFINQVGRFIQFRLRNTQAGSNIFIQAFMPGFQPVGRIL